MSDRVAVFNDGPDRAGRHAGARCTSGPATRVRRRLRRHLQPAHGRGRPGRARPRTACSPSARRRSASARGRRTRPHADGDRVAGGTVARGRLRGRRHPRSSSTSTRAAHSSPSRRTSRPSPPPARRPGALAGDPRTPAVAVPRRRGRPAHRPVATRRQPAVDAPAGGSMSAGSRHDARSPRPRRRARAAPAAGGGVGTAARAARAADSSRRRSTSAVARRRRGPGQHRRLGRVRGERLQRPEGRLGDRRSRSRPAARSTTRSPAPPTRWSR